MSISAISHAVTVPGMFHRMPAEAPRKPPEQVDSPDVPALDERLSDSDKKSLQSAYSLLVFLIAAQLEIYRLVRQTANEQNSNMAKVWQKQTDQTYEKRVDGGQLAMVGSIAGAALGVLVTSVGAAISIKAINGQRDLQLEKVAGRDKPAAGSGATTVPAEMDASTSADLLPQQPASPKAPTRDLAADLPSPDTLPRVRDVQAGVGGDPTSGVEREARLAKYATVGPVLGTQGPMLGGVVTSAWQSSSTTAQADAERKGMEAQMIESTRGVFANDAAGTNDSVKSLLPMLRDTNNAIEQVGSTIAAQAA